MNLETTHENNHDKKKISQKAAPFFSIIIPVFNRSKTITDTLDSVLNQTVSDYECIIVDDGSDDSEALKAVINDIQDPRFKYYWQENGGGGAARNMGIKATTGQYVAFLDSDDLFLRTKLEVFAQQIALHPKAVLYSAMYVDRGVGKHWIRPDRGITANEDIGEYLFVHNQFIQTSTIVLPREIALSTLFDPALKKGQDLDFCLRLYHNGARFRMIEEALTIWVDQTEIGRTSRTSGFTAPLEWLEQSQSLLTDKAQKGYRATVLFYYLAKHQPLTGLKDLALGLFCAGVPFKVICRQLLRGFLPRSFYRKLVNGVVGQSGEKIPSNSNATLSQ